MLSRWSGRFYCWDRTRESMAPKVDIPFVTVEKQPREQTPSAGGVAGTET